MSAFGKQTTSECHLIGYFNAAIIRSVHIRNRMLSPLHLQMSWYMGIRTGLTATYHMHHHAISPGLYIFTALTWLFNMADKIPRDVMALREFKYESPYHVFVEVAGCCAWFWCGVYIIQNVDWCRPVQDSQIALSTEWDNPKDNLSILYSIARDPAHVTW